MGQGNLLCVCPFGVLKPVPEPRLHAMAHSELPCHRDTGRGWLIYPQQSRRPPREPSVRGGVAALLPRRDETRLRCLLPLGRRRTGAAIVRAPHMLTAGRVRSVHQWRSTAPARREHGTQERSSPVRPYPLPTSIARPRAARHNPGGIQAVAHTLVRPTSRAPRTYFRRTCSPA